MSHESEFQADELTMLSGLEAEVTDLRKRRDQPLGDVLCCGAHENHEIWYTDVYGIYGMDMDGLEDDARSMEFQHDGL